MADSRVLIEIVSTAKGLKVVAKDTEKLAKNVERTDKAYKDTEKSGNKYHKQEKAIHQSNLSTAKGFSKMKETMGSGSSGLVGAYATLAANVFAATAAFNALRQAAQVETLAEGFNFLANTSGRTSELIANNLREITGNALSLEGALRASAIAVTSGFSTTQLEKLAEVGKNASIALGRNLGDSVDRLTRGVAKLEPEILDELGIMVRLDTAVRRYAATIGKTATELTDFERRQAFLNEAISQGESKYAALTDEIDVNPYDKLSATFADLTRNIMTFINSAISPLVGIFAKSQVAIFGAILFLAKGIIATMFPVLTDLGERFSQTALRAQNAADAIKSSTQKAFEAQTAKVAEIGTKKGDTAGFQALVAGAKKGEVSTKQVNTALKSLRQSEALRKKNLDKFEGEDRKNKEKELKRIQKLRKEVEKLQDAESKRGQAGTGSIRAGARAQRADIIATGATAIGGAGAREGFKIANQSLQEVRKNLTATRIQIAGTGKSFKGFGIMAMNGFRIAGAGAKLFGAALINAIPVIGQIIFAIGLAIPLLQKFFANAAPLSKAMGNLNKVVDKSGEKFEQLEKVNKKLDEQILQFNVDLAAAGEIQDESIRKAKEQEAAFGAFRLEVAKTNNVLRVQAGVLSEVASGIDELGTALADPDNTPSEAAKFFTRFFQSAGDGLKSLGNSIAEGFADFTKDSAIINFFRDSADEADNSKFQFEQFSRGIQNAIDNVADDGVRAQLESVFGKEGLQARLDELTAKGYDFNTIQTIISNDFNKLANDAQGAIATIDNLPVAFEELTKKIIAFSDKNRKKNEFLVMAKDIGTFNKELQSIFDNAGGGEAGLKAVQDNLASVVGPEVLEQFTNMGLTVNDLVTGTKQLVDENGNVKTVIDGTLVGLQDSFKSVGDRLAVLKEEKEQHKLTTALLKKQADLTLESMANEAMLNNLREKGIFELGPQAELEQALATAAIRKKQTEDDFKERKTFLEDEQKLELDQLKLRADLNETEKETRRLALVESHQLAMDLLDLEAKTTKEKLEAARLKAINEAGQKGTLLDRIGSVTAENQRVGEDGELVGTGKTVFDDAGFQQKIEMTRGVLTPFMDDLAKFGPDGELINSIASGTLTIASSIATIGEAGEFSAEKMQAVGDVIGSIAGIMAANGKSQIAEIDRQIAAEKKRDGKSKESLAKIKNMEKEKEKIARKNFEMNKKMQIAQTIANTAAGVMKTMGDTGFFGAPLAMAVAAMGAAQVALIQKQTFQGGGGSPDAAAKPQNIQIGKRQNKVDVSQRANAGELAYLRGERGIGSNANNFRPVGGAAGMKSYAAGSMLVGEQGPEIVTTNSPTTVTPNDKLGGGTSNVNFTINAVDAAGVQQVLEEQKGNIIGMIREAAHAHGEEFIEAVDTSAYGEASGGVGGGGGYG